LFIDDAFNFVDRLNSSYVLDGKVVRGALVQLPHVRRGLRIGNHPTSHRLLRAHHVLEGTVTILPRPIVTLVLGWRKHILELHELVILQLLPMSFLR